ncbi:hypothetical protein K9K85_02365 [Patescibacteria group bacterium]|nr:hypothetical protein [Patescibacteria group bacterium]
MSNNKNIFSLFKIVAFVFLIIFVVIISVSWPHFPLSLSLVFVLLLLCFLKNWKTGVWLTIVFGGFFLDLYSIFPPGFFLLSLGFFYLVIKKISRRFNVSSGSGFFFLILGSALIYKIIILALSSIFYFLKLSNQLIAINYFYFLDVFWFMIVNSFFVFLILATFKVWSQK